MTRVLMVGANGQIARVATRLFLERGDVELTLCLPRAGRLAKLAVGKRYPAHLAARAGR